MRVVGRLLCAGLFAVVPSRADSPPIVPVAPTLPIAWASETSSPTPLSDETQSLGLERAVRAACSADERRLRDVAHWMLARKLAGLPMPGPDAVAFAQRAAGEPHPWARVWVASGYRRVDDITIDRLTAWLDGDDGQAGARLRAGRGRCGVAEGIGQDGTRAVAVVTVDALADLAPLPTRAHVGQWLTVEARLRVSATGARVIVLGPSGVPRSLLASFDGASVRARFAPDSPGEFDVQVLADLAFGPRPVLEATVFADEEPRSAPPSSDAPGVASDAAADPRLDDDSALARMVTAARVWAGLPPFRRDARLDEIARAHAARMARTQILAHDAGDGDPVERLRRAGVLARDAGENVAHAKGLALAHSMMWASPSHRANLLRRDFDRIGLATARDAAGDAWVVEAFVSDAL